MTTRRESARPMSLGVASFLFLTVCAAKIGVAGEVNPGWQNEWEKTVQAARRERQVTVYTSTTGAELQAEPFRKEFPEIKLVTINIAPAELGQRVMAERRAGKYIADVVTTGANPNYQVFHAAGILNPIKPALLLPEVVDRSKWWQGSHWYLDTEREYVFVYLGNVARVASYNTTQIKPAEFKSYWDFLDPRWKGKILAQDIRGAGSGGDAMRFFYHRSELGPGFIKRLFSEQEITLTRDSRQGVDWLAQGKFPLCLFCSGTGVERAKGQGLPVDHLDPHRFKEGAPLGVGFGTLVLMNRAPHPNAARVFINWLLSRNGQITLQNEMAKGGAGPDSLRMDIPKDAVAPAYRRREVASYLLVAQAEFTDMRPIYRVFEEALADARKR